MRNSAETSHGRNVDPFSRFLAYLRAIEDAVIRREAMEITALLRKRTATHLPREVREELLMLSRAARGSLRAPVKFLSFQHRMLELAAGGESLPRAQTELRLEATGEAAGGVGSDRGDAKRRYSVDVASTEILRSSFSVASPLMIDRQDSSGPLRRPFSVTFTPSGVIVIV